MSGHNGIRDKTDEDRRKENSRNPSQLERVACLQGMFGLGTAAADAYDWATEYDKAVSIMRPREGADMTAPGPGRCAGKLALGPGIVALGTDANSLVRTPRPPLPLRNG